MKHLPLVALVVLGLACSTAVQGGDWPPMTISKETTYITAPLRKDGYVDYLAALDERCRQGVTPENNSAVLLWKAAGPSYIDAAQREQYFKMLGIPRLPDEGNYFVPLEKYLERIGKPQPSESKHPWWELRDKATKGPWAADDLPDVAGWLAANKGPLALVVAASKRPRRYDPVFARDAEVVIAVNLPAIMQHREMARALWARAMGRLHEGQVDEAADDLLAIHRLARLIGQGPTLMDCMVAWAIDSIGCFGDQVLLQHARLTSAQALRLRDALRSLPPMPRLGEKIDIGGRFLFLDCISMIARDGIVSLAKIENSGTTVIHFHWGAREISFGKLHPNADEPNGLLDWVLNALGWMFVDCDRLMRMGNGWFDRIAAANRLPTWSQRVAVFTTIQKELLELQLASTRSKSIGYFILDPRRVATEWVGAKLIELLEDTLSTAGQDRAAMQFELAQLAFALAAYRADHDEYPEKLTGLVPKYTAAIPDDLFAGRPLRYRVEGDGYLLYSVGVNGKDDGGRTYGDLDRDDGDDVRIRVFGGRGGHVVVPLPKLRDRPHR